MIKLISELTKQNINEIAPACYKLIFTLCCIEKFYLNNTFITELKENTFSDITFNVIDIEYCSKLKTIHKNAFNHTDQVTTELNINFNPVLISNENTSIFEIANKFVHAII